MKEDGRERAGDPDPLGWRLLIYDVVTAIAGVLLVGGLLLAVSGVWPPLVAIESPSMEPHVDTGDLVFVMAEERFPGPAAHGDTGVVTARAAPDGDYTKFEQSGDVIVYEPGGDGSTTPIIHRAMFWVEADERWFDEADPRFVGPYDGCDEMPQCPAPNAGFVTKGDGNSNYDQTSAGGRARPVKPDWVIGTAEARVPFLGRLRLGLSGLAGGSPVEGNGSATNGIAG